MTTTAAPTSTRPTVALIPCGAEKLGHAAPARDLYTSSTFRMALAAAESQCDQVFILSAKHGLLALDTLVDPYDVRMGDAGCVTADTVAAQAEQYGLTDGEFGAEVYAFLPSKYMAVADEAFRSHYVYIADVYEADAGIGYQRQTLRIAATERAA